MFDEEQKPAKQEVGNVCTIKVEMEMIDWQYVSDWSRVVCFPYVNINTSIREHHLGVDLFVKPFLRKWPHICITLLTLYGKVNHAQLNQFG